MRERWKVIENHPAYSVSSMGRVRNDRTGLLLKPYDDGRGYMRVKIDGRCERLHILVATAFIPNPEGKPIVNHIHGRKWDCRASQLEWATASENTLHAYRTGLIRRAARMGGLNGTNRSKNQRSPEKCRAHAEAACSPDRVQTK